MTAQILIRPLAERDLPAAEKICRVAFGTRFGAPDPETFWSDLDYVWGRWRADHTAGFAAEIGGEVVGSSFATNWGSVGVLGPVTVRPDLWDKGVGGRLVEAAVARFDLWGTKHAGLCTFPGSAKHVGLYQKFGFWPRFLTAVMAQPVEPDETRIPATRYSDLGEAERRAVAALCRNLTDAVYEGLDVSGEISAVCDQDLGDTVLMHDRSGVVGLAICHYGPRSEAGAGACLIKFGAVRPGPAAEQTFGQLLDAAAALAGEARMSKLVAGVNMARHEAYRYLIAGGFRTEAQVVAMHRPNEAGYSRPGVYVLDDWR